MLDLIPLLAGGTMLACLGSACSTQVSGAAARLSVRDSAGVQVVESNGGPAETWRLESAPEVDLGGGDTDDLFRVTGVALLSDGRIAVANGGTSEIRYYSRDGRLVRAAGGAGGGPGEFSMLVGFMVGAADTLLAFDAIAGKLSIFGPDGRFDRSLRLEPVEGYTPLFTPVGWLSSGSLAMRARAESRQVGLPANGTRSERPDEAVVLFGPDGRAGAVLGPFPGAERTLQVSGGSDRSFTIRSVSVPFQKDLHTAALDSLVAVGTTDRYEIRLYGLGGELRRIIRDMREPRRVTSADVDDWVASRVGAEPGSAVFHERRREYDGMQLPESLPAFGTLRLGAGGALWVREYEVRPAPEVRWRVFDPRSRNLAEITMPSAFRPYQIGEDFVLGVWADDLGVERIRLYRVRKTTGRSST